MKYRLSTRNIHNNTHLEQPDGCYEQHIQKRPAVHENRTDYSKNLLFTYFFNDSASQVSPNFQTLVFRARQEFEDIGYKLL